MEPKHLLIIDDEDLIREVTRLSLEMTEGERVSTANCGTLESRWQDAKSRTQSSWT
jgi:hypothetical protein